MLGSPHFRSVEMDARCTFFSRNHLIDEGVTNLLAEVSKGHFALPDDVTPAGMVLHQQAWLLARVPVKGEA